MSASRLLSESAPLLPAKATSRPGLDIAGGLFGGVARDYKNRSKFYWSDWTDGICLKTVSSSFFMFFATFTSTLALGQHIHDSTDGLFGINEYLMMNSIGGILHVMFGCQPLLVLRPTGPITLLIEKLVSISKSFSLPFWPFFAWTGIFVSLFMFVIAATELSRHIKKMTRFTENIFAFFIGTIYMWDGISGMLGLCRQLVGTGQPDLSAAMTLVSLNFTIGFVVLALLLGTATRTSLFTKNVRYLLVDYAITITLIVSCLLANLVSHHGFPVTFIDAGNVGFRTTASRTWIPHLTELSFQGIALAAASALLIVIFFYLDQNISSWIMQAPEMKLKKGDYYHSSFAFMAGLNFLGPIFGLPFVTGSLPHSPQFAMALADYHPDKTIAHVHENRIAPLIMYALLALPLVAPSVLSLVPMSAVDGTLIVVGLTGLQQTQLYERIMLMITEPSQYPSDKRYAQVPPLRMHLFTVFQLSCWASCWIFNVKLGLSFPLFVASLLPLRYYVLPFLFTKDELGKLEDDEDEIRRFHHGYREPKSSPKESSEADGHAVT